MVREMAKELSDCARMTGRDMARVYHYAYHSNTIVCESVAQTTLFYVACETTAHVTLNDVIASYRASEMLAVSQGEI